MQNSNVLSDGILRFVFEGLELQVWDGEKQVACYPYSHHCKLEMIRHKAMHRNVGRQARTLLNQTYETLMDEPEMQDYL